MKATFAELEINQVIVKKHFRTEVGDLSTLESSIRKMGLLYPIIVDKDNVLILGERRLTACKNVGLTTIPVLKVDVPFDGMAALDIRSDISLCRQSLSQADLDRLIEMKKSVMNTDIAPSTGMLSRLKKLFLQK